MTHHDTEDDTGVPAGGSGGQTWLAQLERGMDQFIHISHVASPDELPGMVAAAAAVFGGEDAAIYLGDLQQRVLVPFQRSGVHSHDAYAQVLRIAPPSPVARSSRCSATRNPRRREATATGSGRGCR